MPKSISAAGFRPSISAAGFRPSTAALNPLDNRHFTDISLLCRLRTEGSSMTHAESAGNWAFGPWGATPVEQLKLRWMKGDPRHRKIEHLERLAALRHMGEPFGGGGGPMWGRGGPFGPHGRGRKRRGDVRIALL